MARLNHLMEGREYITITEYHDPLTKEPCILKVNPNFRLFLTNDLNENEIIQEKEN
jgi:midasin (ATPase involved in ribosome maturation)